MTAVTATDFNVPSESVKGSSLPVGYNVAPQNAQGNAVVAVKDRDSEMKAVGAATYTAKIEAQRAKGMQRYESLFAKAGVQPRRTRPGAALQPGADARARNRLILDAHRVTAPTRAEVNKIIAKDSAPDSKTIVLPSRVIQRREIEQRAARGALRAGAMIAEFTGVGPVTLVAAAAAAVLTPSNGTKTPGLRPDAQQVAELRNVTPKPALRARASLNAKLAPELKTEVPQPRRDLKLAMERTRAPAQRPQMGRRLNPFLQLTA